MRTNRPRENAIRVSERYRRLRAQPDLTIEEINEDVVSIEDRFVADLCRCDKRWLEDMGVSL